MRLYMTDFELIQHFRLAKNKREVVSILADMNDVDVYSMRMYLHGLLGSDVPAANLRKNSVDRNEVKRLYDMGLSDAQISRKLGCARNTITQWRNSSGLKNNTKRA